MILAHSPPPIQLHQHPSPPQIAHVLTAQRFIKPGHRAIGRKQDLPTPGGEFETLSFPEIGPEIGSELFKVPPLCCVGTQIDAVRCEIVEVAVVGLRAGPMEAIQEFRDGLAFRVLSRDSRGEAEPNKREQNESSHGGLDLCF